MLSSPTTLCALVVALGALFSSVVAQDACPLQLTEPSQPAIPFETCSEFKANACCSYGETELIASWLEQEQADNYNIAQPIKVQSERDVEPEQLVRMCHRSLELVGCAKSCAPDSFKFVDVETQTFHICYDFCQDFFQDCIDVTENRFVNAQTFCEAQTLDNGFSIAVRDFDCYGATAGSGSLESYAFGRGLYDGPADQDNTFFVQAVDRFGNELSSSAGDVFVPALLDADGRSLDIEIEDRNDGTYAVTYSAPPGTYIVDVRYMARSIKNVPVTVELSGTALCTLKNDEPPKPQPSLAMCCEFKGSSCCDNFDLRPWGDDFEAIDIEFGAHPECKKMLDHMLCGIPCSPTQSQHIMLSDMADMDANTTAIVGTHTVCNDFCGSVWKACGGCPVSGVGLTVAAMYSAHDFCKAVAPEGWKIEVADRNCFGGSNEASPAGTFATSDAVPGTRTRVGEIATWTVTIADNNGNSVLSADNHVTARLEGTDGAPQVNVRDNGDGTRTLSFTGTRSGTYKLHIELDGVELASSPYSAVIWPGDFAPSQSVVYGELTYQPARVGQLTSFLVGARDSQGNDMLVGEYDFSAVVLSGPEDGIVVQEPVQMPNATSRFFVVPSKEGDYLINVMATDNGATFPVGIVSFSVFPPNDDFSSYDPTRSFAAGHGLSNAIVGSPSSFVIFAVDEDGARRDIGGDQLQVRISGTDSQTGERVELNPIAVDNNDGTYIVSYTILTTAGAYIVDIRDQATGTRIRPTPAVIIAREPETDSERNAAFDASRSSVEASGLLGDAEPIVGVPVPITITARNFAGEVMHRGGIAWNVELRGPINDPSTARTTQGVVIDNLDGTYTALVTAVGDSGRYQLDVRPAGVSTSEPSVQGFPTATALFRDSADGAGLFDKQYTEVVGAGLTATAAGRVAQFTVVAKDAFAVPLTVGGLVVQATLTSVADDTITPVLINDNQDGTYTGTYVVPADAPGMYSLVVVAEGEELYSGTVLVSEVGSGMLELANTIVSGNFRNAEVNKLSAIVVALRDDQSKPFVSSSVNVVVELRSGNTRLPATVVNRGDGSYQATFTIEQPGPYKLYIAVAGQQLPNSPYDFIGVFELPQINPLMTVELKHKPHTTLMDRIVYSLQTEKQHIVTFVGEKTSFVVRPITANGDAVSENGGAAIAVRVEGARRMASYVTDNKDGSYVVHISPNAVGVFQVHATMDGVEIDLPLTILVKSAKGEGELDVSKSMAFGKGLSFATVGLLNTLRVLTVDAVGMPMEKGGHEFVARFVAHSDDADVVAFEQPLRDNHDGSYSLRYQVQRAVPHVVTIVHVASGAVVPRTPALIAVHEAPAAAPGTTLNHEFVPSHALLDGAGLHYALSGRTARFRVTTRDAYKQQLLSGGLSLHAVVHGPRQVAAHLIDNGDGTYDVEYQPPMAGRYVVAVRTADGTAVGPQENYPITCVEWLSAESTSIFGFGDVVDAGKTVHFTAFVRDASHRLLDIGGAWLTAKVSINKEWRKAQVIDREDGSYAITFVVPANAREQVLMQLFLSDMPVFAEPLSARVNVDDTASTTALMIAHEQTTIEPLSEQQQLPLVEAVHSTFTLRTFDADASPLMHGGEPLQAQLITKGIPGSLLSESLDVDVLDNHDGTYSLSLLVAHRGASTITRVLRVTLGDRVVVERDVAVRELTAFVAPSTDATVASVAASTAAASAARSFVAGSAVATPVAVGAPLQFVVQPLDASGAPVAASDLFTDQLRVQLRGAPSTGPARIELPMTPSVADNRRVAVPFDAPRAQLATGFYLLDASLDGKPLHGAPYVVQVVTPQSLGTFEPLATSFESFDDERKSLRVVTRDSSGKRLTYGGLKLLALLAEEHSEHETPVVDNADGTYDIEVRSTESGAAQVKVLMAGTGHLLMRRQVSTTSQDTCPHLWRALSAGAAFGKTETDTEFFIKPCDCTGASVASGIDTSSYASIEERLQLVLLDAHGGQLDDNDAFSLVDFEDGTPGVTNLEDGSLRLRYNGAVCGASELRILVDGQDIYNSPHRLTFVDPQSGDADCDCPGHVDALPARIGGGEGVCSGHGICAIDTCVCGGGWSGDACDLPPNPTLTSVQFSPTGDRINVEFDQPVFRPVRNGQGVIVDEVPLGLKIDCNDLLDNSNSALGNNPRCVQTSVTTIAIEPDSDASIAPAIPGAAVTANNRIILREGGVASTATEEGNPGVTSAVAAPPALERVAPIVTVSGPSVLSTCVTANAVRYEAAATGLGGRPGVYVWSVNGNTDALNNIVVANTDDLLDGDEFFNALANESRNLIFTVCVTNFLNAQGCTSFTVTRDNLASSSISFVGPTRRRVSADQVNTIDTELDLQAEVPGSSSCAPIADDQVDKTLYTWRLIDGPQGRNSLRDANLKLNGKTLVIPANTLTPGGQYTFEVVADAYELRSKVLRKIDGASDLKSTIVLDVEDESTIIAKIVPGGDRLVAQSERIVLDASQSRDTAPDAAPDGSDLTYKWRCFARGDRRRSCWTTDGAPTESSSRLTFQPKQLLPDRYTIEVDVQRGTAKETAVTHIEVTPEQVPTVTLTSGGLLRGDSINPHEPFVLVADAESTRGLDIKNAEWVIQPPVKEGLIVSSGDGRSLYVPPGTLEAGVDYKFEYTAVDSTAEGSPTGSASQNIRVGGGPAGDGRCSITQPVESDDGLVRAVELDTDVVVVCDGYERPARVMVTYQDIGDEENLANDNIARLVESGADEVTLLAVPRNYNPGEEIAVQLPDGNKRLFAYVIDNDGAAKRDALGVVRVSDVPLADVGSREEELVTRKAELGRALEENDFDRATQVTNVLVQDEQSAQGCVDVASAVNDGYRPPQTGFASRQQAVWVERQATDCAPSTELRDAHLGILERVAQNDDARAAYVPLGTAPAVGAATAAAAGATVLAAARSGGNVAGEDVASSPETASTFLSLTRSLGLQLCNGLVPGAPATTMGSADAFSMRVGRYRVATMPLSSQHAGTTVQLPQRVVALLEDKAEADEACVVHAVHGLGASPYGLASNVSSPVVTFDIYAGSSAQRSPFAVVEQEQVSRKRQVALQPQPYAFGNLPQPVRITLAQDARGRGGNIDVLCSSFNHAQQAWSQNGCRAVADEVDDAGLFTCTCDSLSTSFGTLLAPPINLPAAASPARLAVQNAPDRREGFDVDYGLLFLLLVLAVLLYCCFCVLWYVKRNNLRYEYLRAQRERDLEAAGGAVAYAGYKSEASAEDASLLLRRAAIDISQSVSSSAAPSSSSSELGGRGVMSHSSTSTSELGRTDSSTGSELGISDDSRSMRESSSSSGMSNSGTDTGSSDDSSSSSVSMTESSTLSSSSSSSSGDADDKENTILQKGGAADERENTILQKAAPVLNNNDQSSSSTSTHSEIIGQADDDSESEILGEGETSHESKYPVPEVGAPETAPAGAIVSPGVDDTPDNVAGGASDVRAATAGDDDADLEVHAEDTAPAGAVVSAGVDEDSDDVHSEIIGEASDNSVSESL